MRNNIFNTYKSLLAKGFVQFVDFLPANNSTFKLVQNHYSFDLSIIYLL